MKDDGELARASPRTRHASRFYLPLRDHQKVVSNKLEQEAAQHAGLVVRIALLRGERTKADSHRF